MVHHAILKTSPSLFGKITIGETLDPHMRWMKINNEIEGQVFFSPDASIFSCPYSGPGAVAASPYLYAFVIPAWQFRDKQGLILGLGAGAGVTLLLALFPELSLTVVEIDPQVISLTRKYFPLIRFYEEQGRLHIVQADAAVYLCECQDVFSFVLLDLFSGDESNASNLALIHQATKIAPYFMANFIMTKKMQSNINFPNSFWLLAAPAFSAENANWMLTNIDTLSPEIHDYRLFENLSTHQNIMTANQHFTYILSQVDAACFYR